MDDEYAPRLVTEGATGARAESASASEVEANAEVGTEAEVGAEAEAPKWNSWWSRRSSNVVTNSNSPVALGLDAGSKTLKLVALDTQGGVVFSLYHRHRSDIAASLAELLHEVIWRYGDMTLPLAVTGSAGIAISQRFGVPFVQEVVATTNAVRRRCPQADCVIELGGEDAKITYLTGGVEQRMNATCAGGTGDFIDGIASMLGVKTRAISKLALSSQRTYPIASRCAVFAQTDVRPLINAGAAKADIAQSALEAVVRQTLGGLACGRPIRGNVVFLGGPLEHIPALVIAFRHQLGLDQHTGIKPPDAHLFAAMGAIEARPDAPSVSLSQFEQRLRDWQLARDAENSCWGEECLSERVCDGGHGEMDVAGSPSALHGQLECQCGQECDSREGGTPVLAPLFDDDNERREFELRHADERVERVPLSGVNGPLYLGFDAGSTTMKYALVDASGALVASDYRDVEGDTLRTATALVEELLMRLREGAGSKSPRRIARAVVTGYGEALLRAGLGFDNGVVETVAHLRAARQFQPDVSFVLDIGGQDMKALWVRDGQVVDAVLNEACSSGCGAFVQSSAKSLCLSHDEFSRQALAARHPIDLGAKCTVFMTSRVRHAQKAGAPIGDIAAGVAYSVANNVTNRIIGKARAASFGDKVVVQGGAFKSDAVLRAFEKLTGVNAVRPDAAHLMGAYGAALVARDACVPDGFYNCGDQGVFPAPDGQGESSLLTLEQIRALSPCATTSRCPGCSNACVLSIVDFGNGHQFISGNRCERAYDLLPVETHAAGLRAEHRPPNVVALEQRLIDSYRDVAAEGVRGAVTIGLMNVMNVYEATPFWHELLKRLGFSIVVPNDEESAALRDRAAETVPSESVCHPAKLAHVRCAYLASRNASFVFMPRFERGTRCPVACLYADALADNVEGVRFVAPVLQAIEPQGIATRECDREALLEAMNHMAPSGCAIDAAEFDSALEAAVSEQTSFEQAVRDASEKARQWVHADNGRRLAVLVGRPYHMDAALSHSADRELTQLGFAVIPELGLKGESHKKALWKPARHLVNLVRDCARDPQLEIVALRSFGCGYDAVSFDEAHDTAAALHRPFTELKVDDIADTAHIRIRLRTLAYTTALGKPAIEAAIDGGEEGMPRARQCTPDLCSTAKAIAQMGAAALDADPALEHVTMPEVCLDCLTDALPFELHRMKGTVPEVEKTPFMTQEPFRSRTQHDGKGLKVGLIGNPLLVFNPALNDHVDELLSDLGCAVVYPDPSLVTVEDVRFLEQLETFRREGVQRIIYLQSFGCLKGHVQSRGAAHQLSRLYPDMPITVIDYDAESSALNRENRIRLAVST